MLAHNIICTNVTLLLPVDYYNIGDVCFDKNTSGASMQGDGSTVLHNVRACNTKGEGLYVYFCTFSLAT